MKRSALAVLAVLAVALLVVGCGGGSGASSSTPGGGKKATAPNAPAGSKVVACAADTGETIELRATAVDCGTAERTMTRWGQARGCVLPAGASRSSCSLGAFRCQAVRAGRGVAVSCARPGAAVDFVAKTR
jgi:predicted small secreted protein